MTKARPKKSQLGDLLGPDFESAFRQIFQDDSDGAAAHNKDWRDNAPEERCDCAPHKSETE